MHEKERFSRASRLNFNDGSASGYAAFLHFISEYRRQILDGWRLENCG
jgi:hypothetical protein